MSLCLASSPSTVTSERSIQDSDFSLRAQQVMQTAMKLPPHILPTLDELEPSTSESREVRDKTIGVYVPGKSRPVGIYVPKNAARKKTSRKKPTRRPLFSRYDPQWYHFSNSETVVRRSSDFSETPLLSL